MQASFYSCTVVNRHPSRLFLRPKKPVTKKGLWKKGIILPELEAGKLPPKPIDNVCNCQTPYINQCEILICIICHTMRVSGSFTVYVTEKKPLDLADQQIHTIHLSKSTIQFSDYGDCHFHKRNSKLQFQNWSFY